MPAIELEDRKVDIFDGGGGCGCFLHIQFYETNVENWKFVHVHARQKMALFCTLFCRKNKKLTKKN